MLARRCRPLNAPRSAAMGEMQGALARARLESLLRPRHKKRVEAQKRSESVLLSGLGKCRRPARQDSGAPRSGRGTAGEPGGCVLGRGREGHREGERWAVSVHCGVHSGSTGEEMENHRGPPPLQCLPPAQADRGRVQSGRVLLAQPTEASVLPGAAGTNHLGHRSYSPIFWQLGPQPAGRLGPGAGPCCGRGPESLPGPSCPAPWRLWAYKVGRAAGAHCWLSRSHCSFRSLWAFFGYRDDDRQN